MTESIFNDMIYVYTLLVSYSNSVLHDLFHSDDLIV